MKIFTLLFGRKDKTPKTHWNSTIEKEKSQGVTLFMTNGVLHR